MTHSQFMRIAMPATIFAAIFPTLVAADAVGYPVHISGPAEALINLFFGLLGAVTGFLTKHFVGPNKKLPFDATTTAYIEMAIQGSLRLAERKALLAAKDIKDPFVKSQVVADAVNFIVDQVPKVADFYGLNRQAVTNMVLQRISLHSGEVTNVGINQPGNGSL